MPPRDEVASGPIERIEIENAPPRQSNIGKKGAATAGQGPRGQFRWKLWSGRRLVFVATGLAVAAEIGAMIESTDVTVKTTLGTNPNSQEATTGTTHG